MTKLIDESLEGGARDRSLFNNVVNQTHVVRYGELDVGQWKKELMMWHKQVNVNTDLGWPTMWRIENVARLKTNAANTRSSFVADYIKLPKSPDKTQIVR